MMKWIKRQRPEIDTIKKFVVSEAEFLYVIKEELFEEVKHLNAIPYDIPGTAYTHQGDYCTPDYIIKKHKLMTVR